MNAARKSCQLTLVQLRLRSPHHHVLKLGQAKYFHVSACTRIMYDPADPRLSHVEVKTHGAVYDVGYFDSGPKDGATVLAIHGAPGGATDFDSLSSMLADKGVRVIAPNLPGNGVTKRQGRTKYTYSTQDRAKFIDRFLDAIQLKNVDIALGHSVGGPPVINLAANTDRVKSISLLNSVGHIMHSGVKPHCVIRTYFGGLRLPILGSLLRWPLVPIYQLRGFKVDDVNTLVSSMAIVAKIDFSQIKRDAKRVREKGLPIFSASCQDDRIVEWDRCLKVTLLAAGEDTPVSYYDRKEILRDGPDIDENLPSRMLVFDKGRHFCHKSHPELVLKGLMDLITHVQSPKPVENVVNGLINPAEITVLR